MEITGKDFMFAIPDRDAVLIAARQLKDTGQPITYQAVAQLSGLSVDLVRVITDEIKREQK